MHGLIASIFGSFVRESLPDCELCPWRCDEMFLLLGTGEVKPFPVLGDLPDHWAAWPRCPRSFDSTCLVGVGAGSVEELIRWEYERGTHRHPLLTVGASELFRVWTLYRERPRQLRDHMAAVKLAEKTGKGTTS